MTPTQITSIQLKDLEQHLKKKYGKKFRLQTLSRYYSSEATFQVVDQLEKSDSFRSINFPLIRDRDYRFLPLVDLSTLDNHLENQGRVVEGPVVNFPGLLAQAKYSEFDFHAVAKAYSWDVKYFEDSPASNLIQMTVEGGWRKLNCNHRFSFTAQVQSDESIFNLFKQIKSTCGLGPSWKEFSQHFPDLLLDPESDFLLFVATQDDPFLGPKSSWKRLEGMDIEEFTGLLWRAILEKTVLRVALMKESEFESLEMKAKGKKEEEKAKALESHAKQKEIELENVRLESRTSPQLVNIDSATIKSFEAMHKDTVRRLEAMHREISELIRVAINKPMHRDEKISRYDPRRLR